VKAHLTHRGNRVPPGSNVSQWTETFCLTSNLLRSVISVMSLMSNNWIARRHGLSWTK